jgi:hypothetical protein
MVSFVVIRFGDDSLCLAIRFGSDNKCSFSSHLND